ncbi:hypothetical protein Hanom_Chr16g01510811 [Helianthus anomalus]
MAESSAAGARRRGAGRGRGHGQEKMVVDDFEETTQFVCVIPRGTVAHRCLGGLREMELDAPRTIDIDFLNNIGSIGRVREFMPSTSEWARLFEVGQEWAHRDITL